MTWYSTFASLLQALSSLGSTGAKWAAIIAIQTAVLALLGLAVERALRSRGFATRAIALQLATVVLCIAPIGTLALARRNAAITPAATDMARWLARGTVDGGSRLAARAERAVRAARTTRAARAFRNAHAAQRLIAPLRGIDYRRGFRVAARAGVGALVLVWIAGVLLSSLRLATGALTLHRLRRRAHGTVANGEEILFSEEIDIPFVHGVIHPAIVFPAAAEGVLHVEPWNVILAHERAHLARRDPLMQWLRQIAVTIHWWNPLVTRLARATDVAVEGACDDEVLSGGARPTTYANAMLTFADAAQPFHAERAVALPFVEPSALEQRIRAVLERHRDRRGVAPADFLMPVLVGVAASLLVACATPHPSSFRVSSMWRSRPSMPSFRRARAEQPRLPGMYTLPGPKTPPEPFRYDEQTEALLGLAKLLDDASPQVRQTAAEALLRWPRGEATALLGGVARTRFGTPRERAERALNVLRASEENR